MKKTLIGLCVFSVLSLAYYVAGSVYPQEIYDGAIGFEAGLSELDEKQTDISIGTISYYENRQNKQQKPSVVLVHGFGAYKENWLRFARQFKDDFHVVVIDLPGHGKSVKTMELNYSLPNQMAWVNEFTTKLGIDQFHMAGNSMGGAITALYAAQYPQKILSATLLDPAGVHKHRSVMQDLLEKGVNPLVVEDHKGFNQLMDFALEQAPFVPWPMTVISAQRAKTLKPLHDKLWLDMQVHQNEYFERALKTITVPVQVQWGQQDRVINYKNIEVFETLVPQVSTHVWPQVGHVPMVEIPKQSAQLMLNHMLR